MTAPDDDLKLFHCPALTTLKIVSGKWKTRILWLLRERPHHFNALRRRLPGVSAKVLTEQIYQLERAGIVAGTDQTIDGQAHRFYDYTPYGRGLIPALDALGDWGLAHQARDTRR